MRGVYLIRRCVFLDILTEIKAIEQIQDKTVMQEKAKKFAEWYLTNNTNDYLCDVIEFLTEMFRLDYFEEQNYFEFYSDVIQKLTDYFIEQIYNHNMNSRNIDVLLFVAGVAYDYSYKYYEKLEIVRLVLSSPYITDPQKLYAVNMVLDGEPETTSEMTVEEIDKYRRIQKELS